MFVRSLLTLGSIAVSASLAAAAGVEGCLAERSHAARAGCLETLFSQRPVSEEDLERLGRRVREVPGDAGLLSLALVEDDGVSRLTWFTGGDGSADGVAAPAWSAGIDPGDGRLERAARALIEAGKLDQARPLLERALRLGAGDWAEEAWRRTGGGPVGGLDPHPAVLGVRPWFARLPGVELSLIDGGTLDLSAARGEVMVLDFWATWCAPCIRSLPQLQRLQREFEGRGFKAVTVNAEEPDEIVREFARQIDLTLPIARYDGNVHRAFGVRSLPTAILVDREGRMRARWNGYAEGLEAKIGQRVSDLLAGVDPDGDPWPMAEVLVGASLLEGRWVRRGVSPVQGLALSAAGSGAPRVLVARTTRLATLDPGGDVLGEFNVPPSAGRLRLADLDGDSRSELVSFRVGSHELLVFDLEAEAYLAWRSPSHVFDVALLPAGARPGAPGQILLATADGVYRADREGKDIHKIEGSVQSSALTLSGTSLQVLTTDGRVQRFDPSDRPAGESPAPVWSWGLVTDLDASAGWGTLPVSVLDVAVGRFLPDGGRQAALATDTGQLLLIDLADGSVRFRARWEAIEHLAGGDLDGDGRDELLVGSGRRVALLSAREPIERLQGDSQ